MEAQATFSSSGAVPTRRRCSAGQRPWRGHGPWWAAPPRSRARSDRLPPRRCERCGRPAPSPAVPSAPSGVGGLDAGRVPARSRAVRALVGRPSPRSSCAGTPPPRHVRDPARRGPGSGPTRRVGRRSAGAGADRCRGRSPRGGGRAPPAPSGPVVRERTRRHGPLAASAQAWARWGGGPTVGVGPTVPVRTGQLPQGRLWPAGPIRSPRRRLYARFEACRTCRVSGPLPGGSAIGCPP